LGQNNLPHSTQKFGFTAVVQGLGWGNNSFAPLYPQEKCMKIGDHFDDSWYELKMLYQDASPVLKWSALAAGAFVLGIIIGLVF
jgi:hypothetical protein